MFAKDGQPVAFFSSRGTPPKATDPGINGFPRSIKEYSFGEHAWGDRFRIFKHLLHDRHKLFDYLLGFTALKPLYNVALTPYNKHTVVQPVTLFELRHPGAMGISDSVENITIDISNA
jgi:hypothetical protein